MLEIPSPRRLRPRSGYDILAVIATFAALGTGGAYAAGQMVTSENIADGTVAGIDIKDASITGADVAPNTLTGTHVADGTVAGSDVKDASISGADVAPGTLTATHIADGTVAGSDVKDASISGADVAPNTLTGTHVAESSLGKVPSATTADVAGNVYVKSLGYHNVAADHIYRSYMGLNLPAGKYAFTVKVPAWNSSDDWGLTCRLYLDETELDVAAASAEQNIDLTLIAAGSLPAAGTAELRCAQNAATDHDGSITSAKIMAVKVANVTKQ